MPKFWRLFRSFHGLLWLLSVTAALFLLGYPLAENLWAYCTWQQTPCWVGPEGRYFFEYNGARYYGTSLDFWDGLNRPATPATGTEILENNAVCYVDTGQPLQAVLNLDAHKHLDQALPRLAVVVMLLVATAILSFATRKRPGSLFLYTPAPLKSPDRPNP